MDNIAHARLYNNKPHLHAILYQVGIREGRKRFREKENNALLKELNQLHK